MKKTLIALLGVPVMLLGLAGWALPVIPGFPLFLLGLAMMIGWHPRGRALIDRIRQKAREILARYGVVGRKKDELTEDLFVEKTQNKVIKKN